LARTSASAVAARSGSADAAWLSMNALNLPVIASPQRKAPGPFDPGALWIVSVGSGYSRS